MLGRCRALGIEGLRDLGFRAADMVEPQHSSWIAILADSAFGYHETSQLHIPSQDASMYHKKKARGAFHEAEGNN